MRIWKDYVPAPPWNHNKPQTEKNKLETTIDKAYLQVHFACLGINIVDITTY